MQPIKYGKMLLVLAVLLQSAFSAVYTVSQDGTANFTSIQAAVDKAQENDEIIIKDMAIYKEQVTIDSTKSGLYLHSVNPKLLQKPTIKFQDTKNVNPKTNAEAKKDETINFDRNGALQVLHAKRVRIEGIAVDGVEPYTFGYDAIWDDGGQMWPLQHGNGGITLWIAGDCIIRYCDISNSFFGISVKDRNIGGVFANPNPSDIDSLNIVPFSGFAQTGNHLFELNRIHNNSFGMYFESSWDLGSTIRYNLFYENHHPTASFAAKVKGLTSEGNNLPGGAILTKDDLLSPLAIYNNTFWHNLFIFVGVWKAGGQHLIFNNIYSSPYVYYSKDETFGGSGHLDMWKSLANRMHNCVIAAQQQAPTANYIAITNDFSQPKAEGDITTKPFPATAEIRYLETDDRFVSTSTSSADFLVPDWSDANVQKYIIDQGWEASGVKDPDGSRADLGAFPSGTNQFDNITTIRPTAPVKLSGTKATISLAINPNRGAQINQPKIVYAGVVTNLDTSDVFGSAYKAISANNIQKVTVGNVTLKEGANTFDVTVPASLGEFAFFEFIIEGNDEYGFPYTTAVGFIPYRKLDYYLQVTVQDAGKTKTLTEVKAGTPVNLHIEAFKVGGTRVQTDITPLKVYLGSGFDLYDVAGVKFDTALVGAVLKGVGDIPAVFHIVPVGGIDQVLAAGRGGDIPFLGASDNIKILPGDPDNVKWFNPASHQPVTIASGTVMPAQAKVYDLYGNLITTPPIAVHCESTKPDYGVIVNQDDVTDATGLVTFLGRVTNGNKNDTFPIVATLPATGKSDTAYMVVGDARDVFRIFYSDTAKYDSTVELHGCSGERFPIVIRAVKSSTGVISADKDNDFEIFPSSGLEVYADDVSLTPITKGKLVNGEMRVWIQSVQKNVINGKVDIVQNGGNVDRGDRSGIYFDVCVNSVVKAVYYANNGYGSVDYLDLTYRDPLTVEEIPDSFDLYWPVKTNENKITVKKDLVTQDPADAKHLLVTINPPFPPEITKITNSAQLGTSYWFNTKTPGAPVNKEDFTIIDGVGPLIATATLIERLDAGNDTILVTFTENVSPEVVAGVTLYLIKQGTTTPIEMKVLSALPGPGTSIKVVTNITPNPAVGDSLKIIETGTIVDAAGNKAHKDNRPAPIVLKPVPADIADAVYLDVNADGQIDLVKITFRKNVDPNQTAIQLKWEGNKQAGSDFSGAALAMLGTDTVTIAITDTTFGFDKKLLNRTSGNMDVTATFFAFTEDNTRSAKVRDGAAPVIDKIEYHKGMYLEDNTVADDTLFVKYTEELAGGLPNPDPKQPVNFERVGVVTPITYDATRDLGITQDQFHRFIVAADQLVKPITGDSAWIKVDGITDPAQNAVDLVGNVQDKESNRRVLIKVIKPKFKLYVAAGPKPCDPNDLDVNNRKIKIVMSPPPKITETISTTFRVTLNFYDKVGNLVKSYPKDLSPLETEYEVVNGFIVANNKFDIKWDCTNSNQRIVGSGTYVCIIKGTYETGEEADKEQFLIDQRVLLGVQSKK